MKRNIDLTTDFDFRDSNAHTIKLSPSIPHIKRKIFNNIVDIPYCINNDIECYQRGSIIQGDRYRRQFIQTISYNIYCERCGRPLRYPWENFQGYLCPQCDEILKEEFTRMPWNNA